VPEDASSERAEEVLVQVIEAAVIGGEEAVGADPSCLRRWDEGLEAAGRRLLDKRAVALLGERLDQRKRAEAGLNPQSFPRAPVSGPGRSPS